MIWEEEVAKQEKMCPMRMTFLETGVFKAGNCFGSKCMAWRGSLAATVRLPQAVGDEAAEEYATPAKGYCGMAGPPA